MAIKLMFRVDASVELGTGHVMRCLAIAEACLKSGWRIIFIAAFCPDWLKVRIRHSGHEFVECANDQQLKARFEDFEPDLLVVDGYHFSPEYRFFLKALGAPVMLLDDSIIQRPLYTEYLLNPQPSVDYNDYPELAADHCLLGLDYLPLRKEFRLMKKMLPDLSERQCILINFGGTDAARLSLPVLNALLKSSNLSTVIFDLIVLETHVDIKAIKSIASNSPRVNLHVNAENMAQLMKKAGLAISAAGSTLWELAAMQVPVIPVIVADNQQVIGQYDFWYEPVDARKNTQDFVISHLQDLTEKMWQNFSERMRMIDYLGHLHLTEGSSNICKAMERIVHNHLS